MAYRKSQSLAARALKDVFVCVMAPLGLYLLCHFHYFVTVTYAGASFIALARVVATAGERQETLSGSTFTARPSKWGDEDTSSSTSPSATFSFIVVTVLSAEMCTMCVWEEEDSTLNLK